MVAIIILCAIILFVVFQKLLYILWNRGIGELPDGPIPVPIFGDGLKINGAAPHLTFEYWTRKYGKLYSVLFGNQLVIVISNLELVKKAFKDDRFSGRPNGVWNHVWNSTKLPLGPAEAEGEVWREQRRFSLHALRDFGFGKDIGEGYIFKEASNLITILEESGGEPLDNKIPLATAASNVIAHILFSDSFNSEDSRFINYLQDVSANFQEIPYAGIMEIFPLLKFVPPFSIAINRAQLRVKNQVEVMRELLKDHKKTFDSLNPRDYIDAYFLEQQENKFGYTDDQLIANVTDLFAASIETTATFLRWSLLTMIAFPEVQKKVHAELDKVVGRNRQITYADRVNLPYVDATLVEVFRFCNFGPFMLPHKTTEKVEFEGFVIPKDTTVLGFAWWIMKDPSLWKNPSEFLPQRFLTEDEKMNHNMANFVAMFSVGKRSCPGESLARMETFLFFSWILQKFVIRGETDEIPSFERINGLTLTPKPYRMRAIPRK